MQKHSGSFSSHAEPTPEWIYEESHANTPTLSARRSHQLSARLQYWWLVISTLLLPYSQKHFYNAGLRCMDSAMFGLSRPTSRCCTEWFHAFSLDCFGKSITHNVRRLSRSIVRGNSLFRVMGHSICDDEVS